MRLGCCGSIEQAELFKAVGFDFLEVNVQQVLRGDDDDATWSASAPDLGKLALPIEAANCLVPGSHPIVGPQRDLKVLSAYMHRVARRAKQLGLKILVFGSGGARKRPEGVDTKQADDHLAEFTRIAGDACAACDVTLVIEHLHRGETNTLNRLRETRELCDRVRHSHVAVLVDSYHYALEKERDDNLLILGDRLAHVHIAEPIDRIQPGAHGPAGESPKAFDFEHFFALLCKIGYRGRISIEAGWTGPIDQAGPPCVAMLRQAWDVATEDELQSDSA